MAPVSSLPASPAPPARYAVTVDGAKHVVELHGVAGDGGDGAGGKLRVVVDQRERILDVRRLDDGSSSMCWSVIDGTSARLIQVDGTLPKLMVSVSHAEGEPRLCAVEVASAPTAQELAEKAAAAGRGSRPQGPAQGPIVVRSPIPGRLVKVLVKAGDVVQAGQALLILEAMKMENELRAPRAGTVSAVHAAEGTAVDGGQDLVSLA